MITRGTFLASATAVVAGITAAVFWQQLHAERLRTAELQSRITQLEQRPAPAPGVPQVVPVPMPDASAQPATATAVQPPVASLPPVPVNPVPNVTVVSSAVANMMQDPDFCAAQKATLRGRMVQTYPDAGKVLRLSATQSSALTELLLKHQESGLPCGPEGANRQPRIAGKALEDAQQAEIEALLGPAKFQEFQEYLPTRESRLNVNRLRDAVASTDTPLNEQQATTLLNTALSEGKRLRAEMAALPPPTDSRSNLEYQEARLRLTEESQARTAASAQSYLSQAQMAVMKNAMTAVNSRQRAMLRTQRMVLENGSNAPLNGQPILIQADPR